MNDTGSASYRFTPRVLKRWATRNLQLIPTVSGGHEAIFRFQGSTCGNIEFTLLYYVTLGKAESGHEIQWMRCRPEPHGDGHTRMCCWRESDAMVVEWMRNETPLLGRPLDEAVSWQPNTSASGCLCHVDGREHKWSAVLQTIHFALNQTTS